MTRIATLPGDGIGPEVTGGGARGAGRGRRGRGRGARLRRRLDRRHGVALTDEVLAACRSADAVLLGAVGGPKWDTTDPAKPRPEQGLLGVRKGLGLFANLRPVRAIPALYAASPLREERIAGTDLLVVRELTGGIYFGAKDAHGDSRRATCATTRVERDRADRPRRVRRGAHARHERRQGQRARDLAAVARGRHARPRRGVPGASSSSTCSSTTPRWRWSARRAAST